jgi:hypothetical protein
VAVLAADALFDGGREPAEVYCWALFPLLLSVAGITICWRHPSLSRLVLAAMLALAGVLIMLAAICSGIRG